MDSWTTAAQRAAWALGFLLGACSGVGGEGDEGAVAEGGGGPEGHSGIHLSAHGGFAGPALSTSGPSSPRLLPDSGLTLMAVGPHDREPGTGGEGWTGGWRAPSFDNASIHRDEDADPPFDAFIRTRYPEGLRDGRGPVHWYGWHEDGPFTEFRHVRIEKWMRIGGDRRDFESHPAGTKLGFLGAGACDGVRAELYPLLEGGLRDRFQVRVVQQFLDRKNMTQNARRDRVVQAGHWQRWEYELILNEVGRNDGVMRVEVDGRRIIDYNDVRYRDREHPCGLQVWRWNPTWGGSSNDVKSRDDDIDIAEVRIWGEPLQR